MLIPWSILEMEENQVKPSIPEPLLPLRAGAGRSAIRVSELFCDSSGRSLVAWGLEHTRGGARTVRSGDG